MDRINGADTVDIGGGRRGFRSESLVGGIPGTEVTDEWANAVQEEIMKVIEVAGLVPDPADWSQLFQALKILGLSPGRNRRWLAVLSMTLSSAPGAPAQGDAYLIPTGATGIWTAQVGNIAEWSGSAWTYETPPNGHGISLPDGRIYVRESGAYVQLTATTTHLGLVTLATLAEALAGTNSTKAMTPQGLAATLAATQLGIRASALFQAAGISTWNVPDGVTKAYLKVIGGGGGGGSANTSYRNGGGGGGGGVSEGWVTLTPGQAITVTVGAGGNAASAGGTSSFGSLMSATGGSGGGIGVPGQSGIGTGGSLNFGLGDGAGAIAGSNAYASGVGGGPGGSVGRDGTGPGGGGGGSYDSGTSGSLVAGKGSAGLVVIMY